MEISKDKRVVLTLDAGGTNFVFAALKEGRILGNSIRKASNAKDLDLCIATIKEGFKELQNNIVEKAVAISFAFPGPADYPNGIIGDLGNLPAFRGGVPLKAILEEAFDLPVFINNDGDLYAYGEALGGILPEINMELQNAGSPKRYTNLVGLTLGTGFGAGLVRNKQLYIGDNSTAAEVWLFSNRYYPNVNAEEVVSTRAVVRLYGEFAKVEDTSSLMPKDIFEIARGGQTGDRVAAINAYRETGRALGDVIANLFTFIDGIIVIGGGITGAKDLYMPAVIEELNAKFESYDGNKIPRLVQRVFNLDNTNERKAFCKDYSKEIKVPGSDRTVVYDPLPRLAIATSKIGASEAISLGAYAYALEQIRKED